MKHFKLGVGLFLLLTLIIPNVFAQDDTIADVVVTSTEADEPEFTVLLQLVEAAELTDALADEAAELTVFAPTDEAFEALLEEFDTTLEDLLEQPELIQDILLYHVVDGIVGAEDVMEADSLETLQGGEIAVVVDDDGNVILDDIATVVTTDIKASNGVIHVIDAALLPPDDSAVGSEVADAIGSMADAISDDTEADACVVSTSDADTVRVRVGPGVNRTSVSFLPSEQDFTPLGQAEANDGSLWFQLDKEQAAPGRAINEAWVSADEVDTDGNCDAVGESAPPPIIPIINQPPPQTETSSDGNSDDSTADDGTTDTGGTAAQDPGTLPANGTYTLVFASESHVSCEGGNSIPFPTSDVYNSLSFPVVVQSSRDAIMLGSDRIAYSGPGYYTGQFTVSSGAVATIQIFTGTRNSFTGRLNLSLTIDGVGCSGGTAFTATR